MFRLPKVVCPECGVGFARRDGFVRHMHSFHEHPRSIVCTMCGRTFSRRDHLLRHHRTIHVKCEPYPPPPPPPHNYFCNKPDPASPPFQNSPPNSPQFPPATPASPMEVKEIPPSYEDDDVIDHYPDVTERPQTVQEYRPDVDWKGKRCRTCISIY